MGLFVLLLGAWSPGADQPPPATAPDPIWDGMYAAWKEGGEASLREFVRRNRPAVTPERIKDLALRGRKERGDAALSEARLAIALAAAREIGDPGVEAIVLVKAGQYHLLTGGAAKAIPLLDQALSVSRGLDDLSGQGDALEGRASVLARTAEPAKARADYEEALALYEKAGNVAGQARVQRSLGDLCFKTGDQALAAYEEAVPLLEKAALMGSLGGIYSSIGIVHQLTGDFPTALAMFERALPLYEQVNSRLGRGNVCLGLGDLDLRRGDPARALACYQQALACFRQCEDPQAQATALAGAAKAQAQAGRNEPALANYEEALGLLEQIRRRTGLEELKLSFMELVLEHYESAAAFMLEKGFGENAFRTAERMKARLFLDRLAEGLVDLEKGVDPESRKTRDDLEARLGALRKQLQDLASARLTEEERAQRAERGVAVTGGGLAGGQARRGMEQAGLTLARLPETGEEVKAIGALFDRRQKGAALFLRLEASEEHAKEADLSGYGYLHFAAHGLLDDDYQAIALSQAPGVGEDGFLTLSEIMNLHWDARVVVLSACETGLGKVRRGEGVTGLTRAVMYAGSPAAVVSLWSVSDKGTKELMTRFYGAMVGKRLAPADALRQAKLEMAASERWRSPYYWAAFVLYGE